MRTTVIVLMRDHPFFFWVQLFHYRFSTTCGSWFMNMILAQFVGSPFSLEIVLAPREDFLGYVSQVTLWAGASFVKGTSSGVTFQTIPALPTGTGRFLLDTNTPSKHEESDQQQSLGIPFGTCYACRTPVVVLTCQTSCNLNLFTSQTTFVVDWKHIFLELAYWVKSSYPFRLCPSSHYFSSASLVSKPELISSQFS